MGWGTADVRSIWKNNKPQLLMVAAVIVVAALAIGYTIVKDTQIPSAPDLTGEKKQAENVVKLYEDSVRKKDAKKAWDTLTTGVKKGSKLSMFEKAVKDFPATFKKYEVDPKATDLLVNMPYAGDYAKLLTQDIMQKSYVVLSNYPGVDKDSEYRNAVFVVVPEKGEYKIYDIR
ncbi:MAG: hypothetical protein ACYC1U_02220 [Candidatus Aquicultorales bacterium]